MTTWYRAGTATFTNGATAVTGTGTAWVENVRGGDALHAPDGRVYEIADVVADTFVDLATPYLGPTVGGADYAIQPTRGLLQQFYDTVQTWLGVQRDYVDGPLSGRFGNGSVLNPSISFINDLNTGVYRKDRDTIGIAAGGAEAMTISPSGIAIAGTLEASRITGTLDLTPPDAARPNVVLQRHVVESAWTTRDTTGVTADWVGLAYMPERGRMVAVAEAGTGGRAMYSDDLVTWTASATPDDASWRDVEYIPERDRLVAVAQDGTGGRVMVSDDGGETWADRTAAETGNSWHVLKYMARRSRLVAVARAGNAVRIMYSDDDGDTWTGVAPPVARIFRGIEYIPEQDRLIATAGTGNRVITSDDGGETWIERVAAAGNGWAGIVYIPERRRLVTVATSGTGNRVMVSDDYGETWETRPSAADNSWYDLAYSPRLGLLVAVSFSGTGNRIMTSGDYGETWETQTSPADNAWFRVDWSEDHGCFVACAFAGANDRIMTSASAYSYPYLT